PRHKGAPPPLPRLAFLIGGAAAGYFYLAPWLQGQLIRWDILPELTQPGSPSIPILASVLCALAGWLAGKLLNQLLSWIFRGFNRGFSAATGGYTWLVGRALR